MKIELNKIYNMDCIEGMKTLPDNCVDLTVTSPPYDDMRAYDSGDIFSWSKCEEVIKQLYRVTKEGGTVVWIVADSVHNGDESGTSFWQALAFKRLGFKLKDTMIYIKNGGINAGALNAYQQKFEYMFVFTKGKQKTYNLIKDRPNKYVEDRIKKKKQKDGTYKEQHFKAEKYGVRYNYWIYDTGSGKSTLLQHLNGLLKPESGDIFFEDENIWASKENVRKCRFGVGLCFQYPEHQLFESTVFEDIAFGPKNMGLSESEIKERVLESIKFVGLTEDYLEKSPFDLSGGEKRRVAIAGVISMKPKVLVLDEPTAGLDPVGKNDLLNLIKHYNQTTGSTVIFVSHNMDDVALVANRVLVLSDGEIVMNGSVDEVYSRGSELLKLGLDVPEITRVLLKLSREGFDVPTDVYTVNDAKEKLVEFLKRGKKNG